MSEQIEAVQRMQEYIAAHLEEPLSLEALAQAAGYSPWHAGRLFARETGLPPAEYIRRLRLSRSALQLRDSGCKVTDLAFQLGFGSVDGYQRAFRRTFHCNPGEYAAHPVPLCLFRPYGVKFRDMERKPAMKQWNHVFLQVMEKPARKVILKRGTAATDYWTYCQEVGCDVWGLLSSIRSLGGEPVCLWLPPACRRPGTSEYVQGVEVSLDDATPVPAGFETIQLPPAKYLMFQGEPFQEGDDCLAAQGVRDAMEKYDPSVIGYAWDREQPRIQLEPIGSRGYIELMPLKENKP